MPRIFPFPGYSLNRQAHHREKTGLRLPSGREHIHQSVATGKRLRTPRDKRITTQLARYRDRGHTQGIIQDMKLLSMQGVSSRHRRVRGLQGFGVFPRRAYRRQYGESPFPYPWPRYTSRW